MKSKARYPIEPPDVYRPRIKSEEPLMKLIHEAAMRDNLLYKEVLERAVLFYTFVDPKTIRWVIGGSKMGQ